MSKLAYRTRDNSSPQGKPRVWLCCHPADFESYARVISDEILSDANCAIWYEMEPEAPFDENHLKDDLRQMQLVVIPVTAHFLCEDSRARETEFAWAVERHIPILPLMQEPELEDKFNEVCGDLQFLDKNSDDETAIDYRTKLKGFLDYVLVGDELAAKIRAAFDAYVFLSYRKKDRKYAQELMQLIHKNGFCRDIAIWYDEFLVPGENFNEAIFDALKKSCLFILLVTPNLVNEKNYVMTIEYPMALHEGKTVLPAETVPTDRAILEEKYAGIPECTDVYDEKALEDALKRGLMQIAVGENDNDPEHLFFIGLAYLNGVDVEVDTEKAVKLLQSAANLGLAEAAQKLADMYRDGFGVERNYEISLSWKETCAECLNRKLDETGDSKIGDDLLSALSGIASGSYIMGQAGRAEAAAQNMLAVLEDLQDRFGEEKCEVFEESESLMPRKYAYLLRFSVCCSMLAMYCEAQGKMKEAFRWQERAAESLEAFYQNNIPELADLFREDEETLVQLEYIIWSELSECYENSVERYERLSKQDEAQTWRQRWTEMKGKRLPFARPDDEEDWDWFDEDALGDEKGSNEDWKKISDEDFGMYANCATYSPELMAHLEERIAKFEERYEQTQELELRYTISELYSAMRQLLADEHCLEMKQHEREVEELQREVKECTGRWLESFDAVLEINEEYSCCRNKALSNGKKNARWQKKAEEARNRSEECHRMMVEAEQRMDADQLARVEREWEKKERKYNVEKAMWKEKIHQWDARTLELLLEYVFLLDQEYENEKTPSEEFETKRIETYNRIADMFKQKHDLEGAALWYRKELAFLEDCFSQTHDFRYYNKIGFAYYSIGMLDEECPDKEMLRRALEIFEEVNRCMPDVCMRELVEELERLCAENE